MVDGGECKQNMNIAARQRNIQQFQVGQIPGYPILPIALLCC
jgi:hypothetical protein